MLVCYFPWSAEVPQEVRACVLFLSCCCCDKGSVTCEPHISSNLPCVLTNSPSLFYRRLFFLSSSSFFPRSCIKEGTTYRKGDGQVNVERGKEFASTKRGNAKILRTNQKIVCKLGLSLPLFQMWINIVTRSLPTLVTEKKVISTPMAYSTSRHAGCKRPNCSGSHHLSTRCC